VTIELEVLLHHEKGKAGKRENDEGDKPIWGIVHVYIEMSQQPPPVKLS
jgi:hypothetical protein